MKAGLATRNRLKININLKIKLPFFFFLSLMEERRQGERRGVGFEVRYLPCIRDYKVPPVSPSPAPVLGGLQGQEESSKD